MAGILDAVTDAVGDAVDAVASTGNDAMTSAALKVVESKVKDHTGKEIECDVKDVPDDWKEWMYKTGCNSLCNDSTWDFLEDSDYNKRKRELWEERGITKIIMTVIPDDKIDPDKGKWWLCDVEWKEGEKEFTIVWYPRAKRWASDNTWVNPGSKRWWILRDEIVFGLQLYQLPGKCFYKSDWLDGFDDVDPDGFLPTSTKKFKRWFQFRHWVIMWYANALPGWNYQYTKKPPPSPDGEPFQLSNVLSLPSLPDIKMPNITLPSLPDISLPTISMPSVELPSVEMPSMEMPSVELGSLPSMPDKKQRPKGKWATHGIIELAGMNVKDKGKTLVLSDINVIDLWLENGHVKDERKEHQKFELECTSEEQAESWKLSLMESGAKEGEVGGCCGC